jgi:hypothetical protein
VTLRFPEPQRQFVQASLIIFTFSTFNVGAAGAPFADAAAVDDDGSGRTNVPVISTMWPTCGINLLSSTESWYVGSTADGVALDPVVPVGFIASVRMNAVAVETERPDVPTASGVALTAFTLGWMHPCTTTEFAVADADGAGADGVVDCVAWAARDAQTSTANALVKKILLMWNPPNKKGVLRP